MNIINEMLVDKCFPDNVNARAVVPAYKDKTASGNPITLTDSAENKPLGMTLYGWSKQDGTPSPDNPVEIESAGMRWSMGKNLVNADDYYSAYKQADGTYKSKTVTLNDIRISLSEFVGKEITISVKLTVGANVSGVFLMYISSEQKKINGSVIRSGLTGKSILTITPVSNTDYFVISFGSGNDDVIFSELQLELGSVATSYEPYTGGIPKPYGDKIGVSVRGKNLFHITKESDCDKAFDNTTKRIILPGEYIMGLSSNNYHTVFNASIDLNTYSISFIYSGNSGYGVGIGTNCQKNKTYAFSFETNKGVAYAVFYSEDGTYKARVLISTYNVFVVPDYAAYVIIVLTNNNSAVSGNTIWFKNVQIEETKSITAYEPYRTPQSTAIVTPNGLPGIPVPSNTSGITYTDANGQAWIADDIDLERGKYVQRVWQAEFDGSEDEAWAVSGTTFYSPSLPTNMKFRDGVTNKYAVRNVQNIQCVNFGRGNTALCVANPSEYDGSLDDKGLSNFKAHLAANPLVVMTYLDTPIERDLTSAELAEYTQLYSYKPTTVVENNSGCWMDVTYKAGTSGKSKNEALRWYFKNVMPLVG